MNEQSKKLHNFRFYASRISWDSFYTGIGVTSLVGGSVDLFGDGKLDHPLLILGGVVFSSAFIFYNDLRYGNDKDKNKLEKELGLIEEEK
ncbi:MAG: hypothetical protein AABX88_02155 [Nanoarchaeota archaeon]